MKIDTNNYYGSSMHNQKYQYIAAISVNLMTFGFGNAIGWLNPALPLLQSIYTPLSSGPLTIEEISWLGSILSMGSLIGDFVVVNLTDVIGSRNTVLLLGFPQLCAWFLLMFGTNISHLCIARFLCGLSGSANMISLPIYIAEIADNDIRGRLGTFRFYFRNVGLMFASFVGSYFNYKITAIFSMVATTVFLVSFFFLPSTPQHFLKKKKVIEAEKAYKYYKGLAKSDASTANTAEFIHLKVVAREAEQNSSNILKNFWNARKGFIHAAVLPFLTCGTLSYIFILYGTHISKQSGSQLSPEIVSISLGVVPTLGIIFTSIYVDTKGRKFLLVISLTGCAIGHATMVVYLYLFNKGVDTTLFHWIPAFCMPFIVLIAAVGIVPVSIIYLVEAFPVNVRSFGVTFGNITMNIYAFLIGKTFPILVKQIGLCSSLMIFCFCCVFGVVYIILFVEETKGKELNVSKQSNDSEEETLL